MAEINKENAGGKVGSAPTGARRVPLDGNPANQDAPAAGTKAPVKDAAAKDAPDAGAQRRWQVMIKERRKKRRKKKEKKRRDETAPRFCLSV